GEGMRGGREPCTVGDGRRPAVLRERRHLQRRQVLDRQRSAVGQRAREGQRLLEVQRTRTRRDRRQVAAAVVEDGGRICAQRDRRRVGGDGTRQLQLAAVGDVGPAGQGPAAEVGQGVGEAERAVGG